MTENQPVGLRLDRFPVEKKLLLHKKQASKVLAHAHHFQYHGQKKKYGWGLIALHALANLLLSQPAILDAVRSCHLKVDISAKSFAEARWSS